MGRKYLGWFFCPEGEHLDWEAPANYIRAAVGEVRLRLETDTPLSDKTLFEPGWRRLPSLDCVMG